MLCSVCKKEQAVIFINTPTDKDPKHVTGYCLNCAREKGIKPLESVLSNNDMDLSSLTDQVEAMLNNISNNMDLSDMNLEEGHDNMIPIGAIFGNFFGNNNGSYGELENKNVNSNKRTKVEKKPKEKKKKFLDMYGTNLTNRARNNELDIVIGRDNEIRRIIQILNRRTKNNPCLIGEPGVR